MTDALQRLLEFGAEELQSIRGRLRPPLDYQSLAEMGRGMMNGAFTATYDAALSECLLIPVVVDRLEAYIKARNRFAINLFFGEKTRDRSREDEESEAAKIIDLAADWCAAFRELQRFADAVSAQSAGQGAPAVPVEQKPNDDVPQEDGPRDLSFHCGGKVYPMTPNPYRLFCAMWRRKRRNSHDVEEEVWGSNNVVNTMASLLHDMNQQIEGSGWSLHKQRGEPELFWKKSEISSSIA